MTVGIRGTLRTENQPSRADYGAQDNRRSRPGTPASAENVLSGGSTSKESLDLLTSLGLYWKTGVIGMTDISEHWFVIISEASGKLLTVPPGSLEDGVAIQQQTRHPLVKAGPGDVSWQSWRLVPVDPGIFKIVSAATGKVLDVRGASTEDQAIIQQYTDHGGANQRWVLVLVDDKGPSFLIFSELSKKVLDVPFASTEDGVTIQQYTRKLRQAANQHWIVNVTEQQFEG